MFCYFVHLPYYLNASTLPLFKNVSVLHVSAHFEPPPPPNNLLFAELVSDQ